MDALPVVASLISILCSSVAMFAMFMLGWEKPIYIAFVFEHFCLVLTGAMLLVAIEQFMAVIASALHFRFARTLNAVSAFWDNKNAYIFPDGRMAAVVDSQEEKQEAKKPEPQQPAATIEDPSFSNLSQIAPATSNEGSPTFANDEKFELQSSECSSAATVPA